MHRLLACLAAALSLVMAVSAQAQNYPERNITLVVPLAAGSGTDAVTRILAARLAEKLHANIVVENRVGANGIIGCSFVARAKPDGYTLLVGGTTTHAANPSLMSNVTYDPVKDFAPIGQFGVYPYALLVAGNSPYRSVSDIVTAAKAKPGAITFAYANALGQLSGEVLKGEAGIDIVPVAYRSSPQAITDIIGGRVTMMFVDVPPAISQLEAGTLRALAVTTSNRTQILPNVPTLAEAGATGSRLEAWNGLFAPAGTPQPIIDKLATLLNATLTEPDVKSRLAAIGFEVQPAAPDVFGRRVASEVAQWARLTHEVGIAQQ